LKTWRSGELQLEQRSLVEEEESWRSSLLRCTCRGDRRPHGGRGGV
jgi:hypothetical protein